VKSEGGRMVRLDAGELIMGKELKRAVEDWLEDA
jgi:hypothetical protein